MKNKYKTFSKGFTKSTTQIGYRNNILKQICKNEEEKMKYFQRYPNGDLKVVCDVLGCAPPLHLTGVVTYTTKKQKKGSRQNRLFDCFSHQAMSSHSIHKISQLLTALCKMSDFKLHDFF